MNKDNPTIQEKINQLDELVKYFEDANQGFDLEAGLKKYEEAMKIVQSVKSELESYELKIEQLEAKYSQSEVPSMDELMN